VLLAEGRYPDALAAFERVLRAAPDYAAAHNGAGAALASLGAIDAALPRFEEALRLRPDLPGVRENVEQARRLLAARSSGESPR
jgi:tetratricopeptide (TPR) repeat protein